MDKNFFISAALILVFANAVKAVEMPGRRYMVSITESPVLLKMESLGLSLRSQLGSKPIESRANSLLVANPIYAKVLETINQDLKEFEPQLRPVPPAKGPGHGFPSSWLRSPDTYFELVGIINRLDRKTFLPNSCGELRLIYRLAYRRELRRRLVFSRLPMTINLVFEIPKPTKDSSCLTVAQGWVGPADPALLLEWLQGKQGPLQNVLVGRQKFSRLEINLQSERWEPNYRPDLAGHTGYLLRIFRYHSKKKQLLVERLENTPDVGTLSKDARLRSDFLELLKKPEMLTAIDEGIAVLPEKFMAVRAVSVTPFGMERRANRPFLQIFSPAEFKDLNLASFKTIRSPAALLRRLDALSCVGCHQSKAMAGFHFLGEDEKQDWGTNAVYNAG
jgi:hypothetical protein